MSQINRYNLIKGLKLSLSISVIASIILLINTINGEQFNQMRRIEPLYLLLAIGLMFLMWITQGIRLQILAFALDETLPLKEAVKNYLSGAFVSNVTPFAAGGAPMQVFFLHKTGMSVGKASSIIIVQWILRHLFFGLLGPIFFFFYRNLIDPGQMPEGIFNAAVSGSLLITGILLLFVWKPQIIPILTQRVVNLPLINRFFYQRMNRVRFDQRMNQIFHEIEVFHECLWILTARKKTAFILTLVFTGLFWIFFFMIPPVILIGLGGRPFFLRAFIMQTIMFLILPYMPTPGASGAAEFGFITFFSPFVPNHLLGILMISWRFLTYYMLILVGSLITLKMLSK